MMDCWLPPRPPPPSAPKFVTARSSGMQYPILHIYPTPQCSIREHLANLASLNPN